jgi:hypothetical protein
MASLAKEQVLGLPEPLLAVLDLRQGRFVIGVPILEIGIDVFEPNGRTRCDLEALEIVHHAPRLAWIGERSGENPPIAFTLSRSIRPGEPAAARSNPRNRSTLKRDSSWAFRRSSGAGGSPARGEETKSVAVPVNVATSCQNPSFALPASGRGTPFALPPFMPEDRALRNGIWETVFIGVLVVVFIPFVIAHVSIDEQKPHSALFCPDCWLGARHSNGERSPAAYLKTLATAQADFRANDRGKTHEQVFWREDVAGLYGLNPGGGTVQDFIKLIEFSVALADDRPKIDLDRLGEKRPKNGYWYRAILKKGEPPIQASSQFACCAFPARYSATRRWTYIIDEGNTIYRADLGHGRGVEVFPDEEELRRLWCKFD